MQMNVKQNTQAEQVKLPMSSRLAPYLDWSRKQGRSLLSQILLYIVLLSLSFVFLYPVLYMVSKSMMQAADLSDATVEWIPKALSLVNYTFMKH